MSRLKNRIIARLLTRYPSLVPLLTGKNATAVEGVVLGETPWAVVNKAVEKSKVALVTTSGVHLKTDPPFDMEDADGDPTFRVIPSDASPSSLMITHDYYDHTDAERDLNIVFPAELLGELAASGEIGGLSPVNYSFMGHIAGAHVRTLYEKSAPAVAEGLRSAGVDLAIFTPG